MASDETNSYGIKNEFLDVVSDVRSPEEEVIFEDQEEEDESQYNTSVYTTSAYGDDGSTTVGGESSTQYTMDSFTRRQLLIRLWEDKQNRGGSQTSRHRNTMDQSATSVSSTKAIPRIISTPTKESTVTTSSASSSFAQATPPSYPPPRVNASATLSPANLPAQHIYHNRQPSPPPIILPETLRVSPSVASSSLGMNPSSSYSSQSSTAPSVPTPPASVHEKSRALLGYESSFSSISSVEGGGSTQSRPQNKRQPESLLFADPTSSDTDAYSTASTIDDGAASYQNQSNRRRGRASYSGSVDDSTGQQQQQQQQHSALRVLTMNASGDDASQHSQTLYHEEAAKRQQHLDHLTGKLKRRQSDIEEQMRSKPHPSIPSSGLESHQEIRAVQSKGIDSQEKKKAKKKQSLPVKYVGLAHRQKSRPGTKTSASDVSIRDYCALAVGLFLITLFLISFLYPTGSFIRVIRDSSSPENDFSSSYSLPNEIFSRGDTPITNILGSPQTATKLQKEVVPERCDTHENEQKLRSEQQQENERNNVDRDSLLLVLKEELEVANGQLREARNHLTREQHAFRQVQTLHEKEKQSLHLLQDVFHQTEQKKNDMLEDIQDLQQQMSVAEQYRISKQQQEEEALGALEKQRVDIELSSNQIRAELHADRAVLEEVRNELQATRKELNDTKSELQKTMVEVKEQERQISLGLQQLEQQARQGKLDAEAARVAAADFKATRAIIEKAQIVKIETERQDAEKDLDQIKQTLRAHEVALHAARDELEPQDKLLVQVEDEVKKRQDEVEKEKSRMAVDQKTLEAAHCRKKVQLKQAAAARVALQKENEDVSAQTACLHSSEPELLEFESTKCDQDAARSRQEQETMAKGQQDEIDVSSLLETENAEQVKKENRGVLRKQKKEAARHVTLRLRDVAEGERIRQIRLVAEEYFRKQNILKVEKAQRRHVKHEADKKCAQRRKIAAAVELEAKKEIQKRHKLERTAHRLALAQQRKLALEDSMNRIFAGMEAMQNRTGSSIEKILVRMEDTLQVFNARMHQIIEPLWCDAVSICSDLIEQDLIQQELVDQSLSKVVGFHLRARLISQTQTAAKDARSASKSEVTAAVKSSAEDTPTRSSPRSIQPSTSTTMKKATIHVGAAATKNGGLANQPVVRTLKELRVYGATASIAIKQGVVSFGELVFAIVVSPVALVFFMMEAGHDACMPLFESTRQYLKSVGRNATRRVAQSAKTFNRKAADAPARVGRGLQSIVQESIALQILHVQLTRELIAASIEVTSAKLSTATNTALRAASNSIEIISSAVESGVRVSSGAAQIEKFASILWMPREHVTPIHKPGPGDKVELDPANISEAAKKPSLFEGKAVLIDSTTGYKAAAPFRFLFMSLVSATIKMNAAVHRMINEVGRLVQVGTARGIHAMASPVVASEKYAKKMA